MPDVKKSLAYVSDLRILVEATEAGCRGTTPPGQVCVPNHVPRHLHASWLAAYAEGYDRFLHEDVDTMDRNS